MIAVMVLSQKQKRNGRIKELMAAIIAVTPVTLANFMFYNYFIKLQ